jgi:aryl-phospho-beta-D-glucosidase BglC (GH1 family)
VAERYKDAGKYVIYELMNEPHGIEVPVWNEIIGRLFKLVRSIDKNHYIIAGGADWNSFKAMKTLPDFEDDKVIVVLNNIAMDKYHQILCLTLKENGKDKVLEAIKALEARLDVLCAEPSYKVSMEAVPSDPYYSSQQWGPQKINLPEAWNYYT